jgi:HSP20 family protein
MILTLAPLSKFNPFQDLMALQQRVNRLFEEAFPSERAELSWTAWTPAVDVYEDTEAILIEADLPGLTKEDVKVSLENNVLTIHGERKLSREDKRDNYHRVERAYGSFTRSFTLPSNVDAQRIGAEFKDGVLRLQLPKREEAKPKQIEVKVK